MPGSTRRTTSPPRPPLPPSGPPSGLNFSRWTEAQPLPPWPACTRSTAWSANSAMIDPLTVIAPGASRNPRHAKGGPASRPACARSFRRLGRLGRARAGDDAHRAATADAAELHRAGHQREQRIVIATANAVARMEVRAALPDDDLARVHRLPAEALDAKPLRARVTAVAAGRRALLVCHCVVPYALDALDALVALVAFSMPVIRTSVYFCRWP